MNKLSNRMFLWKQGGHWNNNNLKYNFSGTNRYLGTSKKCGAR